MSGLEFAAFFRDVHGVLPLPWQSRLAQLLIERHEWPDFIDLPTASGKTACIDIALFHLAWCAHRGEPWKAARRIVFVVDRRIIVDAAAERAERIRAALVEPRTESVRSVTEALRRLGGDTPLECQKLRGGMVREQGFTLNPAQPMVITSTIDQIGSRLLFRGYGLSPYAAPVHAGLLGHDTLILLDEAHLGEPFARTVAAVVREQSRAERPLSPLRPVKLVPMSATVHSTGNRFCLDEADLAHPTIAERRTAPKPARLVQAAPKLSDRLNVLFRETLDVLQELETQTPAVAVIVNRVRTARALFELLRKESAERGFDIELLIGRSRPIDRDLVAQRLLARAGAGREPEPSDRALVVVSTQTIEVGADLDFQGMVTECASLGALRQRFGRLDRLGRFRKARAAIVGGGEPDDDPIYGPALAATWRWLNSIATPVGDHSCVDFSIEAIDRALEGVDIKALSVDSPPVPELTPSFVQLLCQTAPRPAYDPDVPALLHGLNASEPDVQVVWRSDIPVRTLDDHLVLDIESDAVARELLEINPPMSLEAMALPLHAVRSWLEGRGTQAELSDLEGGGTQGAAEQKAQSTIPRQVWRLTPDGWKRAFGRELQPGDTIVVPAGYGGCDEFGFAPESITPVRDLSETARRALGRSPLLVLTKWNIRSFGAIDETRARDAWEAASRAFRERRADPQDVFGLLIDQLGESLTNDRTWLQDDPLIEVIAQNAELNDGRLEALVVTSRKAHRADISDEDLSSSRTVPVALIEHNAGVGARARQLAEAIGLEEAHKINVGRAGDLHDLGKADPRFQLILRGDDFDTLPGQLLAKGMRRVRDLRVEPRERHEAYSVAFLKKNTDLVETAHDPELVLYLIGTHHGRGRALMPNRPDDGTAFAVELDGRTYEFEGAPQLGAVGSGWPSLFWRLNRRYGPWGLAYLEALLRLADQLRSAEELERGALA